MRSCVAAGAFLLAGVSGAAAGGGDYYAMPAQWTGLYVGAHAGYADGGWDLNLSAPGSWSVFYNDQYIPANRSLDDGSLFGGLQAGYNYQVGSLVFGLETDVSWADLNADGTFTSKTTGACAPNSCTQWKVNTSLDVFGTVRGRLGYANGSLLIYGTAGLAWGQAEISVAASHNGPNFPDQGARVSGDFNHIGWTAGGGMEWQFAPNWSLKAEYLYIDLGSEKYVPTGTTTPTSTTPWNEYIPAELDFHTARIGINYRFGDYRAPLK